MPALRVPLPAPPETVPSIDDDFLGPHDRGLDPDTWVAHYLPHWTTPERSAARVRATPSGLELRIEADQPDWRPEDAPLRVSNIQTGTFSGPLGSPRGTHRHRPDDLLVRTQTPTRLLFAPTVGRVDVTVSASTDAGCMLAAWLVGAEHRAEGESGEICIFEIDHDAIGPDESTARVGVKAHSDPHLATDMAEVVVPLDASRPHTWTTIWGAGETVIGCDGVVVRRIHQAPDYPLFLLIDLFEVEAPAGDYPKTAVVHHVRAWDLTPPAAAGD